MATSKGLVALRATSALDGATTFWNPLLAGATVAGSGCAGLAPLADAGRNFAWYSGAHPLSAPTIALCFGSL